MKSKSYYILMLTLLTIFSCSPKTREWLDFSNLETSKTNNTTEEVGNYDTTGYRLIWSDEFNGTSLDTSKWTYEIGNNNGWGNNELEYYTSRTQNVKVSDGKLMIISLKENYAGFQYTSGRIKTQNKFSFQYGKIVARIKFSPGNRQGIWPAFWMLGNNITSVGWPRCGEIDIMENVNGESRIYTTCHWDNNGSHAQYGQPSGYLDITQFHDYEVEWDNQRIIGRVDNVQHYIIDITPAGLSEFHQPFFIILNQAVGGNWPGYPNSSTVFPSIMTVDYVRVYQKN